MVSVELKICTYRISPTLPVVYNIHPYIIFERHRNGHLLGVGIICSEQAEVVMYRHWRISVVVLIAHKIFFFQIQYKKKLKF